MRALGAALFVLCSPRLALAAGGGSVSWWDLFWHGFNLILLLGAIVYFARRPVRAFFSERRSSIRENLEGSARLLEEAEGRLEEWQRRLQRLDAEVEQLRADSHQLAESERERIEGDARASVERLRQDAAAAVDQEVRRARAALRREAADLAVELAERLLREGMTPADRARLIDEFVERIERQPGSPGVGR